MENPIPNVAKAQKKNKFKGSVKSVQQQPVGQQAASAVAQPAQVQQGQQCKPQTA